MAEISEAEQKCLKMIAKVQTTASRPCSEHILQRLIAKGLVEKGPQIWLPLEMMHTTFRLTSKGRALLKNM